MSNPFESVPNPTLREKVINILNSCTMWEGQAREAYIEYKTQQENIANEEARGGTEKDSIRANIKAGIACAKILLDSTNIEFQKRGFEDLEAQEQAAYQDDDNQDLKDEINSIFEAFSS